MNDAFTVTIVGAGMTGLGLAALLANERRIRLRVVDAGPPPLVPRDIGLRVSALSPGSAALLCAADAWQRLPSGRVCGYERMRVWDAASPPEGPATLRFDAEEFALPELGTIVENELVRCALYTALLSTDVVLEFDTAVASLSRTASGFRLVTESGTLATDLLIGADGGRSRVREAMGIDDARHAYGQTAFVTHVRTSLPHGNTARQRFLPSGPFGMLPLFDGRVSIVWSTSPDRAASLLALDDRALGRALTEAADAVLGEIAVTASPRGTWPLACAHAVRYVDAGVALIGDAAHTVHPLAGQGVNLGFADAAELAAVVLAALDAGEYPADRAVLRRYERARRGANDAMIRLLSGLNRLFASDCRAAATLRRRGMQWFNLSGPLRRQALAMALGKSPGRFDFCRA